jgi:hypothetical protein
VTENLKKIYKILGTKQTYQRVNFTVLFDSVVAVAHLCPYEIAARPYDGIGNPQLHGGRSK